jgi:hypothetical protein
MIDFTQRFAAANVRNDRLAFMVLAVVWTIVTMLAYVALSGVWLVIVGLSLHDGPL